MSDERPIDPQHTTRPGDAGAPPDTEAIEAPGADHEPFTTKVPRLKRVGVYLNLDKEAARSAVTRYCRWLRSKGVEPVLRQDQAEEMGERGIPESQFFTEPDILVSMGGDGTFLHVARHIADISPPLLGVNFGRLGYLTAVEANDLVPFCEHLLDGNLPIDRRLRIGCDVEGWDDPPPALNDVVIQDAEGIRTIRMRISLGGKTVGVFRADGIIVATPTGSTAYTLSVGGPVVHPDVEALLFALVSPHTLSARPMVVSDTDTIVVEVLDDRPVRVIIDGQETRRIRPEQPIRMTRARNDMSIIVDPERLFVDRLRRKLSWGGHHTM
jgi:NAD+ kinase